MNNKNLIIPFVDRDLAISACHLMIIIPKENPEAVKKTLNDAGVQTSQHYTLIPDFKDFGGDAFKPKDELIYNSLTIPLHSKMTKEQVVYISDLINKASS